jgi:hypothetical protein
VILDLSLERPSKSGRVAADGGKSATGRKERQRKGWALWAISAEISRSTEMVAKFIITKTEDPGNRM